MIGVGMISSLSRRMFGAGLVCFACLGAPALANSQYAAALDATEWREIRVFDVLRDGKQIGTHQLTISRDGDTTEVLVDVLLEVGFGPIVLYRYEQTNKEIWRDGDFVSFRSETNNDGDDWRVDAVAREGGIAVSVNGKSSEIISAMVATTYWNKATVEQSVLVGTQEGNPLAVEITKVGVQQIVAEGQKIDATLYQMRGELELDLWYDSSDRWVKLAFEFNGSDFDYVLKAPEYTESWTVNATTTSSGSPEQVQGSEED